MRITHVITKSWPYGGSQLVTFYWLRNQQAADDVELVVGEEGTLTRVCEDAEIPVHLVPMVNRVFAPIADVRSLLGLWHHFRRSRPDIVHTHCSKAGILGRLAARLAGVPIVVHTFHAPSFHSEQPRYVYWPLRLAERLCVPLADQLMAVSVTTARAFSDVGVCRPDQIKVILDGFDFASFPMRPFRQRNEIKASLGVGPAEQLVVSVGHLAERKRHDVLIDAAATLCPRYPDARFAIVGTGPLEGALRERIRRSGLEGRVILAGHRNDVPEILASADIFVQTSRLEGLARSLLEALYSELAVAATDVGGTCEVIVDGKTGLLISPGSVQDLISALDQLLGSEDLRNRLGRSARAAAAADRSIESMVQGVAGVYNDLAVRKGIRGQKGHGSRRIVFVINSLVPGGAEGHVVRVALGLKQRGWDVSIFCLSRHGALIEKAEAGGVPVTGGVPLPSRPSIWLLWTLIPLYQYLRRSHPDVVATYLTASDVVGPAAARLAGVRHVVTSRRYLHGHRGPKVVLYRCGMLASDRFSERVIAVSDVVARQAIAEGTPPEVVETIRNSVRVPPETGRVVGPFPGSSVVGTVGRLHPDKGYAYLLEAVPVVLDHVPDAHFVIVGEGRERSALEEQAASLGASDHISFLGERLDVPSLLRQFDVFVLPSLREGMPNALLEAMAAGLPVVASGVGGILEIVRDGDNGLLVQPGCAESLAAAIVRLCTNLELRQELALAARQSVVERFGGIEREVAEVEAVYLQLIGHSGGDEHRTPGAATHGEMHALTSSDIQTLTEPP